MDTHIRSKHSEFASPSQPDTTLKRLPRDLWVDMRLTRDEEDAFGVDEKFRWSTFTHFISSESTEEGVPNSDAVVASGSVGEAGANGKRAAELQDEAGTSVKRARV